MLSEGPYHALRGLYHAIRGSYDRSMPCSQCIDPYHALRRSYHVLTMLSDGHTMPWPSQVSAMFSEGHHMLLDLEVPTMLSEGPTMLSEGHTIMLSPVRGPYHALRDLCAMLSEGATTLGHALRGSPIMLSRGICHALKRVLPC